jgi:hypothetical protein
MDKVLTTVPLALVKAGAYEAANRVQDRLGIADPQLREINCLSWYMCEMQDAGVGMGIWGKVQKEMDKLIQAYSERSKS